MSGIEKKMGIHSTWFFLPADQKHADSYYNLNDKKIKTLIKFLISEGHESALHGTLHSHNSPEALRKILVDFLMVSGRSETGIRQHRLLWKHPDTGLIHEKEGIIYDTTLGFAAHEGFRNSYCHPFRLFDFDNNRMLGYWEIPLTLMESTLFNYRKLDFKQANDSILSLIKEIKKFNGVFTLLWHNSYLNEHEKSGITEFYQNILEEVISEKAESLTGLEIIKRMKSGTNNE
jgi:hypothetical protein